jgi:hypothetical protein
MSLRPMTYPNATILFDRKVEQLDTRAWRG